MQALAKEHSQYGVHGVNIIANGSIRDEDTKETRAGQRMSAESVAETYLWLANQSPTLWTHEVSWEIFRGVVLGHCLPKVNFSNSSLTDCAMPCVLQMFSQLDLRPAQEKF